jgi:hypothetical protein
MKKNFNYFLIYILIFISLLNSCSLIEFDTKRYFGGFMITLLVGLVLLIINLFSKKKK